MAKEKKNPAKTPKTKPNAGGQEFRGSSSGSNILGDNTNISESKYINQRGWWGALGDSTIHNMSNIYPPNVLGNNTGLENISKSSPAPGWYKHLEVSQAPSFINRRRSSSFTASSRASSDLSHEVGLSPVIHWRPLRQNAKALDHANPVDFQSAFDEDDLIPPREHTSEFIKVTEPSSRNSSPISSPFEQGGVVPTKTIRPLMKRRITQVGPEAYEDIFLGITETKSQRADAHSNMKAAEATAENVEVSLEELNSSIISDEENLITKAVNRPLQGNKRQRNYMNPNNLEAAFDASNSNSSKRSKLHSENKSALSSILSDQSNSSVRIATRPFTKKKTNIPSTIDPFAAPFEKTTSPRAVDMYKSTEKSAPSSFLSDRSNSPVRAATRPFTKKKTNVSSTINPYFTAFEETTITHVVDANKSTEKSAHSSILSDQSNSSVRIATRPFTKKKTNIPSTIDPFAAPFEKTTSPRAVDMYKSTEKSAPSSFLSDRSNSPVRAATRPFTKKKTNVSSTINPYFTAFEETTITHVVDPNKSTEKSAHSSILSDQSNSSVRIATRPFTKKKTNIPSTIDPFAAPFEKTTSPRAVDMYKSTEKSAPSSLLSDRSNSPVRAATRPFTKKKTNVSSTINPYVTAFEETAKTHVVDANKSTEKSAHSSIVSDHSNSSVRIATRPFTKKKTNIPSTIDPFAAPFEKTTSPCAADMYKSTEKSAPSSLLSDRSNSPVRAATRPFTKKKTNVSSTINPYCTAFEETTITHVVDPFKSTEKSAHSSILSDQSNSSVRIATRPFTKKKTNIPSTIDPFAAPFEKTTSPRAVDMYKSTEKSAPSSFLSDRSNSPVRAATRPFTKKKTNVSSTINPYVTAFEEATNTHVVDANKSTEKSAHSSIVSDQSNSSVRIATRPFTKKKTNIPSTIDPFAAPFEKTTSPCAADMYKSTEKSAPSSPLSDRSNSPVRAATRPFTKKKTNVSSTINPYVTAFEETAKTHVVDANKSTEKSAHSSIVSDHSNSSVRIATRPFTKKKTNIPSTIDPFAAPFEKTTSPRAVDMYKSTEKSAPSSFLSDRSNSPVRAATRPFTKKKTNVSLTINPYVTAFEETANTHVVDANKSTEKSAHSSIVSDHSNSSVRIATRPFTKKKTNIPSTIDQFAAPFEKTTSPHAVDIYKSTEKSAPSSYHSYQSNSPVRAASRQFTKKKTNVLSTIDLLPSAFQKKADKSLTEFKKFLKQFETASDEEDSNSSMFKNATSVHSSHNLSRDSLQSEAGKQVATKPCKSIKDVEENLDSSIIDVTKSKAVPSIDISVYQVAYNLQSIPGKEAATPLSVDINRNTLEPSEKSDESHTRSKKETSAIGLRAQSVRPASKARKLDDSLDISSKSGDAYRSNDVDKLTLFPKKTLVSGFLSDQDSESAEFDLEPSQISTYMTQSKRGLSRRSMEYLGYINQGIDGRFVNMSEVMKISSKLSQEKRDDLGKYSGRGDRGSAYSANSVREKINSNNTSLIEPDQSVGLQMKVSSSSVRREDHDVNYEPSPIVRTKRVLGVRPPLHPGYNRDVARETARIRQENSLSVISEKGTVPGEGSSKQTVSHPIQENLVLFNPASENRSRRLRMVLTEDEKRHFLEETRKRNRERIRILQEEVEMGLKKRKTMKDYFSTISKKINPIPKPATVPKKAPKPIDPSLLINGKRYRTPRLARPKRWFQDRMYKPILKCCEKKYGPLKKRRKAEEFVIYICDLVSKAMSLRENSLYLVEAVKKALYKLGLIKTLMEFYKFVEDYLPHEFREKAIPCYVGYEQYRGPPWVPGTSLSSELTFKD